MKKHFLLMLLVAAFAVLSAQQQQSPDVLAYIAKYKDIAIQEMVRCKIPASITLAQGIHESNCGKSALAMQANNHFGIKCHTSEDWDGKKYFQDDDAPNECFRSYSNASQSYLDHSNFLVTRTRYAGLFQLPINDYKSWAYGLKADGYATNPKYSQILISTIELYNLTQYDEIGIARIKENDNHPAAMAAAATPAAPASNTAVTTTTAPETD
ncbi:MAG TPA: glucosaminidase domain-containing protein, partial [Chitinophagales bacterium]|nr:glucosaminidase domain-containing protein [Chitinophagales bacterium]